MQPTTRTGREMGGGAAVPLAFVAEIVAGEVPT